MRVVLDTNVVVAAFATQGLCHAVFELCLDRHQINLSSEILHETEEALCKKLKTPAQVAKGVIEYLKDRATITEIEVPLERISRDPKDDHVLAVAAQTGSDFIITGDEDLLVLKRHKRTKIVSPRKFWESMKKAEREEM